MAAEEADVAFKFISTYTPIRDSSGKAVAGLGVDYPMQYVGVVRAGAIQPFLQPYESPLLMGSTLCVDSSR